MDRIRALSFLFQRVTFWRPSIIVKWCYTKNFVSPLPSPHPKKKFLYQSEDTSCCVTSICVYDNFDQTSIDFSNFLFQIYWLPIAQILVPRYSFYLPWWPKQSQLWVLIISDNCSFYMYLTTGGGTWNEEKWSSRWRDPSQTTHIGKHPLHWRTFQT